MTVYKLGVVGNPIQHSLSPTIHQAFAKRAGLSIDYQKYLVEPENIADFVESFFAQDSARGLNITLPFKQDVMPLCDQLTDMASFAGAVNTLIKTEDGKILGDNTDGKGFIRDLELNGMIEPSSRVLVIGAGGAAKGIIAAMKAYGISEMFIINRTVVTAQELAEQFDIHCVTGDVEHEQIDSNTAQFDLVVNSASQGGEALLNQYKVSLNGCHVYDLSYGERAELFLSAAKKGGASKAVDGKGMLIQQAALGFEAWFGVMPETDSISQVL